MNKCWSCTQTNTLVTSPKLYERKYSVSECMSCGAKRLEYIKDGLEVVEWFNDGKLDSTRIKKYIKEELSSCRQTLTSISA